MMASDFTTRSHHHREHLRELMVLKCGHDNEGLFMATQGMLGLGCTSLSFPAHISHHYGQSFSCYLINRTSSSSNTTAGSYSFMMMDL